MKNYKINMNREPLSDADIAKGKNFNQVLKNYHGAKTPFLKAPKFWMGATAALVASVASLVIYNSIVDSDDGNAPASAFVNPPIAQADIKNDKYIVNTETDTTIIHTTGSKIHVPAQAFLDNKGNAVKGQVEITYREFHRISEVLLAGIPMTYDSAGEQYHFETAGMMEIGAAQNGQSLHTNPTALITVDMVSYNNEDRFNTYYLDTTERQWKYLPQINYIKDATAAGVDSIDLGAPLTEAAKKEKHKTEIPKPVEPKKVNPNKPNFSIKVDENEFPEIAVYNNLKFQVNDKSYNPAKADILWEGVNMKRIKGTNNYEITFTRGKDCYIVVATPVFADKDYAEAKQLYEQKYKEYEEKLVQRKANDAKEQADWEAKAKLMEDKVKREMEEDAARRRDYWGRLQQFEMVYRTFQVNNFGIWNCDQPQSLPKGAVVLARITDSKTKDVLYLQTCYLVEKGNNMMYTYDPQAMKQFRFNPAKDNMIWAITRDLKVAVMSVDQFKAAQAGGGKEMQLELNVIDKKFTTPNEVQEYLEI